MPVKVSFQKCPECKGEDQEAFEVQDRVRQKRAKAIKNWKEQSDFMKQKISEAGDDEEFKSETERLLKRCNTLWAGKIKEAELEAATNPSADSAMSEALEKRLGVSEGRIKLMLEAAECLGDQEDHRPVENEDEAGYGNELALLNANCKGWRDLLKSIGELKKRYNEHVMGYVLLVEEELEGIWKDAIRLMKS
jgi:hypothetical protein